MTAVGRDWDLDRKGEDSMEERVAVGARDLGLRQSEGAGGKMII
jgi:hypothetical protein